MRVAGDVDWSSIAWHRLTNAEVAKQVNRSRTHVTRVRKVEGYAPPPKRLKATKPSAKERSAKAKKAYRKLLDAQLVNTNPVIQIVEASTDTGLRFYILVDGRVFVSAHDRPITFHSLAVTRESCEVLHYFATTRQKARVSLCLFKHIKGKLGDLRKRFRCSLVSWEPKSQGTSTEKPCGVTRRRC